MRFSKKKTALSLVLATSLAMSVPLPSALAVEEGGASGSGRAEQPPASAVSPSGQGEDTASSGAEDIAGAGSTSVDSGASDGSEDPSVGDSADKNGQPAINNAAEGSREQPGADAKVAEEAVPLKSDSAEKAAADKSSQKNASVDYQAHVSSIGWQSWVKNGSKAGTTGRSLSMEGLKIKLSSASGGISYQAHVSNIGWQSQVADGALAGTTGRSLGIEAIKISLTGEVASEYDVYYRVHSANLGWLGWARNGEAAGSTGRGLAVQAIEIKLVEKGAAFSGYGSASAFSEPMVSYSAHVSSIGWRSASSDGATAGTTGRSLALEALNVKNASTQVGGSVIGQAYVMHSGWQSEVANGTVGTTGKALPLQALRFHLAGDLAARYDIYYRVHVSNIGWMGWASNGSSAGSLGSGNQIEAVQIRLVSKGSGAPGSTSDSYRGCGLNYQAHSESYGWMTPVTSGKTAGTVGKAKRLEALEISLGDQKYSGSISYQAHVSGIGWTGWQSDGSVAGTTGQCRSIQALKIKLSGEISDHYDIYYRVHSEGFGWLDWAKNGDVAGTTGCSLRAEAVQVKLVPKGSSAPGSTAHPSYILAFSYKANVRNSGWQDSKTSGGVAGTTGKGLPIDQLSMSLKGTNIGGNIQCSVHSSNVGWQDYVNADSVAGVSGKQIEAIKIRLTGDLSSRFDVWYRVHAQNIGWMGWTKNGVSAGTSKLGYRAEAVQIEILPKGSAAPGSTAKPYRDKLYANQAVKRSDGTYVWYNGNGNADRGAAVNKIMGTARSLLGVPYVWLGVYPYDGGMDCASFTWYLYKQLGIDIGFETYDQMFSGKRVGSLAEAKPGDLILMYNGGWPNYNPALYEHVVLYAGNGMIYEEPTFGGRCQYVPLSSKGASTILIRRILAD